jgi:class 3 adenylate cyclase/tetratricopeptide (TPR) repeat protein
MTSFSEWLGKIGLSRYAAVFTEHAIDFDVLRTLSEEDLRELGLVLGDRRRLLQAVAALDTSTVGNIPDAGELSNQSGERRQLTVMFCDLVGSTALAERLDPEELRALMQAYRKACGDVVARYEGHVAQYLGDGLMIYFGWPSAHEDDAERGVRSALEMVQAVKGVTAVRPLAVRIGVATGAVVVGEASSEDNAEAKLAVGETPNLAARLQALAGPDEIVIAPATRRLVGDAFELSDLGARSLKGIAEPVRAWRVDAVHRTEGRFEAAHGETPLTALVGREEEVALLLRRWNQACGGEGQVVLVGGEPGIGKSRMTQVLREQIAGEPYTTLRYQCSPYHLNSALYPIIEQLEFAAGFAREDSSEQKLDKMESVLAGSTEQIAESQPLIAALLSLPTARYPPLKLSPQKQKEKTLDALAGQVEALARRQPLLMVLEDVHWIDATSQELLDMFLGRLPLLPVLLVVTYRPEHTPAWVGQPNVTSLTLNRLGRRQGAELVGKVTGGKALPQEVLEQILAHTDGVPLFVEELTKSVLESGLLREAGDGYLLQAPLPALAIPTSLRDSLLARLDRLAPVKEVAQIGACIGREFSYELLARVSALSNELLEAALPKLTEAGMVYRRGTPPNATYTFKHALVQDAAYDSLLKSRRAQLHTQIAKVLEEDFPDTVDKDPEVLARHFTQAGLDERAVPYWIKAGQRALMRVALPEAVGHLTTALSVNDRLPVSVERDRQELDIRVLLGTAYLAFRGWPAVEIVQILRPARDLAMGIGADGQLVAILWYIGNHHAVRCEYPRTLEVIEELDALAQSRDDSLPFLVARRAEALWRIWMGDFLTARRAGDQLLRAYDPEKHGQLVQIYNQDPKSDTLLWAGVYFWALGYPDQAKQAVLDQLDMARRLGHAFNLCWSLIGGTYALILRGETQLARQWLAEAEAMAREHAMTYLADVMVPWNDGLALISQGNHAEGYAKVTAALKVWRDGDGLLGVPWASAERAAALMGLKRFAEARTLLDEAVEVINRTGHKMYEAEVHRVLGKLHLQGATHDLDAAQISFLKSLEVARTQEAKGFELRAATSLARLWESQGKRREAYELLAPVYNWFTEGFDTHDLEAARELLQSLH